MQRGAQQHQQQTGERSISHSLPERASWLFANGSKTVYLTGRKMESESNACPSLQHDVSARVACSELEKQRLVRRFGFATRARHWTVPVIGVRKRKARNRNNIGNHRDQMTRTHFALTELRTCQFAWACSLEIQPSRTVDIVSHGARWFIYHGIHHLGSIR